MRSRVLVVMMVLAGALAAAGRNALAARLQEMVKAEKAFAALAGEVGVRDAFLRYFDEGAIFFSPAPSRAVEDLRKQPPAPKPLQVLLQWEPMTGEISAEGDFGYLTGPTLTSDLTEKKRPPRHGMYFSVWRWSGGEWKVIVDGGTTTPGPVAEIGKLEFRPNGEPVAQLRRASVGSTRPTLLQAEEELARAVASEGAARAFSRFAAANARLYRSGSYPLMGKAASQHLEKTADIGKPKVQGSGISQAGDLGYTYGAYDGTPNFFMRMWKRDGEGKWQIVYDILHAPRPQPPASQ